MVGKVEQRLQRLLQRQGLVAKCAQIALIVEIRGQGQTERGWHHHLKFVTNSVEF